MQNILISPHFTEMELAESATAKKHGIDNTPPPEAKENLLRLCLYTLEPLREELGLPVVVTSGYRCKELNDIISHKSNQSQHLRGQAADFYVGWSAPLGGRGQHGDGPTARERLVKAFRLVLTSKSIDYDQLILYPTFIHVSFVSRQANRHHVMVAQGNGRYRCVSHETALTID